MRPGYFQRLARLGTGVLVLLVVQTFCAPPSAQAGCSHLVVSRNDPGTLLSLLDPLLDRLAGRSDGNPIPQPARRAPAPSAQVSPRRRQFRPGRWSGQWIRGLGTPANRALCPRLAPPFPRNLSQLTLSSASVASSTRPDSSDNRPPCVGVVQSITGLVRGLRFDCPGLDADKAGLRSGSIGYGRPVTDPNLMVRFQQRVLRRSGRADIPSRDQIAERQGAPSMRGLKPPQWRLRRHIIPPVFVIFQVEIHPA